VNAEDICVVSEIRFEEVFGRRDPFGKGGVTHQAIFLRREDVGAEVEIVILVIDQLEGQHDAKRISAEGRFLYQAMNRARG
jgi:hypothetical protein